MARRGRPARRRPRVDVEGARAHARRAARRDDRGHGVQADGRRRRTSSRPRSSSARPPRTTSPARTSTSRPAPSCTEGEHRRESQLDSRRRSASSVAAAWAAGTCAPTAALRARRGAAASSSQPSATRGSAQPSRRPASRRRLLGSRPAVFSDHEELIASGAVEALDVVTDPAAHHPIAVPALDEGLHVICEKPLGITVRACRAIVDAAARSGAVLATAENYRRDAPNRLARAVIDTRAARRPAPDDADRPRRRRRRDHQPVAPRARGRLDRPRHGRALHRHLLLLPRRRSSRVSGTAFIAEPLRVLAPGTAAGRRDRGGVARV